jgi:Uma2 family endonuclease
VERIEIDPAWRVQLSLDAYHRLVDLGFFTEHDRVEFLEGHIVAMSPQSPPHARIAEIIATAIARATSEPIRVRTHSPLTLARSEPDPDIAVCHAARHAGPRHPTSALLVVEVSGRDSLRKDRSVKAALYAEAGVEEYWVVDLDAAVVRVHRDVDAAAREYRTQVVVGRDGVVSPLVAPAVTLAVEPLFAT